MSRQATPGALVFRVFVVCSLLFLVLPWLYTLSTVDGSSLYNSTPPRCRASLRSITPRLAAGHDLRMQRIFPEGQLFSHSFYGFSLVNIALGDRSDVAFRQRAIAELERLILLVESLTDCVPFKSCAQLIPKGGIILAGHANRLRAGYILLGGTSPSVTADFHRESQTIYSAFLNSPSANVESYPGLIWPVDNVIALDSLRIHDALYKTEFSQAAARWVNYMSNHLDPKTGLMATRILPNGNVAEGPRGCALSWTLAILPSIAPDFARSQYQRYHSWFLHPAGGVGIREWPPGTTGKSDVDSGPVVFDMGMGASGFGIAAAKANNDPDTLTGLLRTLELTAVPAYSPPGFSRSFLGGQVLLIDTLALWGQTVTPWEAPLPPPVTPVPNRHFWVVLLPLWTLSLVAVFLLLRSVRRIRRSLPHPRSGSQRIVLGLHAVLIVAWLLIPSVPWIAVFLLMVSTHIVESRFFPNPQDKP